MEFTLIHLVSASNLLPEGSLLTLILAWSRTILFDQAEKSIRLPAKTDKPMTTIRIREDRSVSQVSIEPNDVSSTAPELQKRIERIVRNFQQLNTLLNDIETKIQSDERLKAIDDSIQEVELNIDGRRRRWRTRQTNSNRPSLPRKPR
jgi:hypothetical protein